MGAYSYVCLYYVCAHNLNENFKVQITILFGFYYSMFLHLPNHPVWVISENRPVGSVIAFVKSLWGHGLSWLLFYHFVQRHVNSWRLKLVWGGGGGGYTNMPTQLQPILAQSVGVNTTRSVAQKNIKFDATLSGATGCHFNAGWHFFPPVSLSHTHTHTHTHKHSWWCQSRLWSPEQCVVSAHDPTHFH